MGESERNGNIRKRERVTYLEKTVGSVGESVEKEKHVQTSNARGGRPEKKRGGSINNFGARPLKKWEGGLYRDRRVS